MRRAGLVICAAACGRVGFEPAARNPDAGTDCWPAWTTGSLTLSAPQQVAELASSLSQGDPWLSRDGLTLYFAAGETAKDLYVARRTERVAPWGAPVRVDDLSSPADDTKVAFTEDGLLAVVASNRAPAVGFDLFQATRAASADAFGAPTQSAVAALNDNLDQYDPHLSGDGLRMYFAPDVGGGRQQVKIATRPTRDAPFGPATTVMLSEAVTSDPTLSPDERVIVYTTPAMSTQIYYATRPTLDDPFSVGQRVPITQATVIDQDPALSHDGCELYFASLRGGPTAQLYVAHVQ